MYKATFIPMSIFIKIILRHGKPLAESPLDSRLHSFYVICRRRTALQQETDDCVQNFKSDSDGCGIVPGGTLMTPGR